MKKVTIDKNRRCPKCGSIENQIKNAYSDETRELALKMYYSGVSGRGVGKILGMNKTNIYNWIKKLNIDVENLPPEHKLDELYWFVGRKGTSETRENVYKCLFNNDDKPKSTFDSRF